MLQLETSSGESVSANIVDDVVLKLLSPHLYNPSEAPHYTRGLSSNLALFVAIMVVVGLAAGWLRILNRKHAAERERLGKSASVVDWSMEKERNLAAHEGDADDGRRASGVGDKASMDITDLKNEDFIYVY